MFREVRGWIDIWNCCLQLLSGEKTCIAADYCTLTKNPTTAKQVEGEGRRAQRSVPGPVPAAPGVHPGGLRGRERRPHTRGQRQPRAERRRARVSHSPDRMSSVVTAVATAAPAAPRPPAAGRAAGARPCPGTLRVPRHAGRGHRPPARARLSLRPGRTPRAPPAHLLLSGARTRGGGSSSRRYQPRPLHFFRPLPPAAPLAPPRPCPPPPAAGNFWRQIRLRHFQPGRTGEKVHPAGPTRSWFTFERYN